MHRFAVSIVAAVLLLATATWSQPSSSPVFLQGETCTLKNTLHVVEQQGSRVLLAKGAELTVTRAGRRFSEVHAGVVVGLVENTALATVCEIERPRCVVEKTLPLTVARPPVHVTRRSKQEPKKPSTLQLQKGGELLVLKRDNNSALVRVGELDATVPLDALLAACPRLPEVFAEEAAKDKAAKDDAAKANAARANKAEDDPAPQRSTRSEAGDAPATMPARH